MEGLEQDHLSLQVLGLSQGADEEEITDALEWKLFEAKKFYLQQIPVPALWKKKMTEALKLDQAANTLLKGEMIKDTLSFIPEDRTLGTERSFPGDYHKELMAARLQITQATTIRTFLLAVKSQYEAEWAYVQDILLKHPEEVEADEVPIREKVEPDQLLDFFEKGEESASAQAAKKEIKRCRKWLVQWSKMQKDLQEVFSQ